MKKIISLSLVAVMVISLALVFVSCSSAANVKGKSFAFDGIEFPSDASTEVRAAEGILKAMFASFKIEFAEDGDTVTSMGQKGTYKTNGNKITITIAGDPMEFTLKDGILSGTDDIEGYGKLTINFKEQ